MTGLTTPRLKHIMGTIATAKSGGRTAAEGEVDLDA
jgi:hypothetical protein